MVLTKALQPELPPEIRMFAAAQLVAIGTPDTVGPLTHAMRDEDERVAIVAVEGLPATKDGAAISALEELAESGPAKVSAAAKRRLSTLQ